MSSSLTTKNLHAKDIWQWVCACLLGYYCLHRCVYDAWHSGITDRLRIGNTWDWLAGFWSAQKMLKISRFWSLAGRSVHLHCLLYCIPSMILYTIWFNTQFHIKASFFSLICCSFNVLFCNVENRQNKGKPMNKFGQEN